MALGHVMAYDACHLSDIRRHMESSGRYEHDQPGMIPLPSTWGMAASSFFVYG